MLWMFFVVCIHKWIEANYELPFVSTHIHTADIPGLFQSLAPKNCHLVITDKMQKCHGRNYYTVFFMSWFRFCYFCGCLKSNRNGNGWRDLSPPLRIPSIQKMGRICRDRAYRKIQAKLRRNLHEWVDGIFHADSHPWAIRSSSHRIRCENSPLSYECEHSVCLRDFPKFYKHMSILHSSAQTAVSVCLIPFRSVVSRCLGITSILRTPRQSDMQSHGTQRRTTCWIWA